MKKTTRGLVILLIIGLLIAGTAIYINLQNKMQKQEQQEIFSGDVQELNLDDEVFNALDQALDSLG